jgi:hypothetical protein
MNKLGIILLVLAVQATNIVFGGYVMSMLWSWFVSPAFGIAELTTTQGAGILVMSSLVTIKMRDIHEAKPIDDTQKAISGLQRLVIIAYILFLGWVISLLV